MFKIGEFSRLMQVSIRMLRYYDENDLLKPAQIDADTGYRWYSADQIPILNKILFLRDTGFTTTEMKTLAPNWSDKAIASALESKRAEAERSVHREEERLAKITEAIEHPFDELALHYEIIIKEIPSQTVLSYRKTIPNYYAEGELWKEMSLLIEKNDIKLSSTQTFTIYHDAEHKEIDVDVELCVPINQPQENVDGLTFRTIEAVSHMACCMVYGSFEGIAPAYRSFAQWLEKSKRYCVGATSRQTVHRGPWNEENSANWLTEIQIPLAKNKD